MGIAVLGPLTVDGQSNGLAPRDRVVLAVLAMTPGAPVSTERLADALWPDQPPASWAKVIQSAVVRLRRVLGPSAIETVPHGYRLTLPARDVDAHEFEHLVVRARAQMVLGEVDRAAYSLDQALRLWRGQALVELEGWDQGRIEASRLAELCRDAEELQVEAALRSGRHREVLARAQALVQAAPLRERRWELLATAQYQSGRQGDALRTLRQVRKVLLDELGLDPGPDVVALEQAILRQDPALAPDLASAEGSALCPYRGLVPFDIEDADDFFGREHDVAVCLERLGATGMLAVVGPSGSGKSSLVRAGVAAALRRDGQRVVVTSPGHRPMDALAAVPASRTPFVLVVDQGEEALSLCEDEQERADFFVALADHARRGPLVLVLRADRLGEISGYDDIARLVEHGLFLLNPMSVDGLRAAIESPAQRAGLHLEPGLTDLLLREVEDEAGGLPLLSHALRQTWQRREGGTLTVDGYRATGGIRHAVAQSAESLYEQVEPDQRPALRDLMLRLVIPTPDGEPTRSRVPRRVVDADGRRADLIDRLVAARLVTSDEGVVEIAHESLVRAWPRLRGWLDEDTEGQRILRHLTIAGDTWDAMGRPDAELYRGARLAQAVEWRDRAAPDLSRTERDFLDAGQRLAETEEQSAIRQAQQQRRVNRRLRGLLAGVAFLLIAALVAGTLAVRQADRATDATRVADARRVASLSQLADPVDDSLQLALAAVGLEDSAETSAALLAALSRSPQLSYHVPAADVPMADLDTHPRNHEAAVMDHAGRVRLYSPDSVDPLAEFDPHPPGWKTSVYCVCDPVTYSPDGRIVAFGLPTLADRPVRLLDWRTLRPLERQLGGQPRRAVPTKVDFSADGRLVAVAFDRVDARLFPLPPVVVVWDLRSPATPVRRIRPAADFLTIEISPDGRRLYVVQEQNSDLPPVPAQVFDVATGQRVASFDGPRAPVDLSPDGTTMAYAEGAGVVLADSTDGRELRRLTGASVSDFGGVTFSPSGERLAATTEPGGITVWDVASGRVSVQIDPVDTGFGDIRFDADANRVLGVSETGLSWLSLLGEDRYIRVAEPPSPRPEAVGWDSRHLSPTGDVVLAQLRHGDTLATRRYLLDLDTDDRVRLEVPGWIGTDFLGSWRPDGLRLALRDGDPIDVSSSVHVVDTETGQVVVERELAVDQLIYAGEGARLLARRGSTFTFLDAETLRTASEPAVVDVGHVMGAIRGPTESTVIVLTGDEPRSGFDFTGIKGWALVHVPTGEVRRRGDFVVSPTSAAVSPDGALLAAAGGGRVEIVELATGASRASGDAAVDTETGGFGLTYSSDGERLVSSDDSGRVTLWDGRTAAPLGTVKPADGTTSVAFLPDNQTVRIAAVDGAVYDWDTSVDHAVDTACRILVGRSMTEAEWSAVLPNQPYQPTCPED